MSWKNINFWKLGKFIPIIGLILFIYMIYAIGIRDIVNTFTSIPFYYYVLAFLPFFIRIILYVYKWQYICKKHKLNFDNLYLTKITLISLFYSVVTPGGFGQHIKILYLKQKSKATFEKCIANSLIDGTITYLTGVTLATVGAFFIIDKFPGLFPILFLIFIVILTIFIVFMKKSHGSKIFKIFIRPLIPKKYREKINQSVDSLYKDIPRLRDLIIPFILEIGIWIVIAIQTFIIARAFDVPIEFHIFFILHTISIVAVAIIPLSVGGLGVREGVLVYLLSEYGVEPEIAFVISLSGFMVKLAIPSLVGIVISFKEKIIYQNDEFNTQV